jgi:hypothetical protein
MSCPTWWCTTTINRIIGYIIVTDCSKPNKSLMDGTTLMRHEECMLWDNHMIAKWRSACEDNFGHKAPMLWSGLQAVDYLLGPHNG